MAASVQQAVEELTAAKRAPAPAPAPLLPSTPEMRANDNQPIANDNSRPGTDPMDFQRANRIHVAHGSLFVDAYLVLHPRELDPKNEAALVEKLKLTWGMNSPSFYEAPERMGVALNLGQLVPVSLNAARSKLVDGIKKFNAQVDTGIDRGLQGQFDDKQHPLAGIVRDVMENPQADPVGLELLQNGLGMYLLLREKLTQNHCLKKLTDYVERSGTPDQVLQDLSAITGITPIQVREAALRGGLEGVGQLLGLDPAYVAEVKELSVKASQQDFSYNLVEHWHLGRQTLGSEASIAQKVATGLEERIRTGIEKFRAEVKYFYDVPAPIKAEEQRIAREELAGLTPIQRQLMFAQGYEICHTQENTADAIAFHPGVWGLHRRAANDLDELRSTNRIYYGMHGSRLGSSETFFHESAHNLWPKFFSKDEVAHIDQLVGDDAKRFTHLQRLMDKEFDTFAKLHDAYKAGDAAEKKAVAAEASERFASYGVDIGALFPQLADAAAFRYLVWDANDVLAIEGARYNHSGYVTSQERFREVLSRFAGKLQGSHHHEPEVLQFVAPGLTQVWERHYIPHLERVYQAITASGQDNAAPSHGLRAANENDLPKVREEPQPQAPDTQSGLAPERADTGVPESTVARDSMAFDNRLQPALSALQTMGISNR